MVELKDFTVSRSMLHSQDRKARDKRNALKGPWRMVENHVTQGFP